MTTLTDTEFKFLVKCLATCLHASPQSVAFQAVQDMTADEWDGLLAKAGLLATVENDSLTVARESRQGAT